MSQTASAAPARVLRGHVPAAVGSLQPSARLDPDAQLTLSIGLPLRNEQALSALLQKLYDPSSPEFHHYLSPEQFTLLFSPSETDYQAAIEFARSNHLAVKGTHPNRLCFEVAGTVDVIEKMLGIRLNLYSHPKENRQFFAPESNPAIPDGVPILDISGLDNFILPHPMSVRVRSQNQVPHPFSGSGTGGSFRGGDFRAAYAPGVTLTGAGQNLGLLEFDGYYTSDITSYLNQSGLPKVTLQNVLLNNFNGTPGGNNIEVALDIEVAIAMAPGLSKVIVYEGTLPNTILNKMATDNSARQLSSSWSYTINSTTENIYKQYAAQGQTMFQAAGDGGAYVGTVDPPCDDPNLTIVGGTTLKTTGPAGAWVSETTWNWANIGIGTNATGGGISAAYSLPAWQQGVSMSSNQGSTSMRNFPDLALTADNIMAIYDNGTTGILGGTSASAPLWAGFMALVNQQAQALGKPSIGFLNPALYGYAKSQNFTAAFHDISTGNNTNASSPGRFFAASGFDLCTGWGSPVGQTTIDALAGSSNSPPVFLANPFAEPTANAGRTYSATIATNASDPNANQTLHFAKVSGPAWLLVSSAGDLSGVAANSDAGTNQFVVSVTDSGGLSNTASLSILVNGAPSFTNASLFWGSANAGQTYSASIAFTATDPNPGDKLTFSKNSGPAWLTIGANGSLSGVPGAAEAGTNAFGVSVTDSGGLSASTTLYITVNAPPSFPNNPFAGPSAVVGQPYSASLAPYASDPNPGDAITFAKLSGPAWLVVAGNGVLSGTPANTDAGTNTFTVSATDTAGLSNSATLHIIVGVPLSVPLEAKLTATSGVLSLSWAGGNPPFQIQTLESLASQNWQNFGSPTTNHSFAVTLTNTAGFFRVVGQ